MKSAVMPLMAVLILAACSRDLPAPLAGTGITEDAHSDLRQAIDQRILETVRTNGRAFNWQEADDDLFWDALSTTDGWMTVGYRNSETTRQALVEIAATGAALHQGRAAMPQDEVAAHADERLGIVRLSVRDRETMERIRNYPGIAFAEVADYQLDYRHFLNSGAGESQRAAGPEPENTPQNMILDPLSAVPYPDQVLAYDGGLRTVIRRHNMEEAYNTYGVFGDGIGVSIIDNGLLPARQDFFYNNGYGDRRQAGYYNFWHFLPWTQPDGVRPRPTDVFGLSILIYDTYYIHGSEMVKQVLTLSPNADITATRGSTWTVIVTADQANGIADAIMAAADDPEIRMISMSMGTIIHFNEIELAIQYFNSKGKMFVCSAGSTFENISDLLGVLFPGYLPESVTATAIENRENTGGEFIITPGSHGGPENDFTVENTNSSSVACSRAAGMISLVWSANPSLTRDELMDVLIEASYYYQLQGHKHEKFGWGTIDVGLAVALAIAG